VNYQIVHFIKHNMLKKLLILGMVKTTAKIFSFLAVIIFFLPTEVFAFTNNSVYPTISPFVLSYDVDASDEAVCQGFDPTIDTYFFVVQDNNSAQTILASSSFNGFPQSLSYSFNTTDWPSLISGRFDGYIVFGCGHADGSGLDGFDAVFPNVQGGIENSYPDSSFFMLSMVDSSGTTTISSSTIQVVDNPNQDFTSLLFLFSFWFFGVYWVFSKKR